MIDEALADMRERLRVAELILAAEQHADAIETANRRRGELLDLMRRLHHIAAPPPAIERPDLIDEAEALLDAVAALETALQPHGGAVAEMARHARRRAALLAAVVRAGA